MGIVEQIINWKLDKLDIWSSDYLLIQMPLHFISSSIWHRPNTNHYIASERRIYLAAESKFSVCEKILESRSRGTFSVLFVCEVGGGTTGSVIASRLTENHNVRVLVIEAGSDGTKLSYFPAFASFMWWYTKFDYRYSSEPQEDSCLALKRGVSPLMHICMEYAYITYRVCSLKRTTDEKQRILAFQNL